MSVPVAVAVCALWLCMRMRSRILTYQAHAACADVCYMAESGRVEGKEAAVEAAQAHACQLQQTVKSITSERQV